MKPKILIVSECFEDGNWRGIDFVTLNILESLSESGQFEVAFLSSVPSVLSNLENINLRHQAFFNNFSKVFVYGIECLYRQMNLNRRRHYELFKLKHLIKNYTKVFNLKCVNGFPLQEFSSSFVHLNYIDTVVSYPFFFKALKFNDQSFINQAIKNILKFYCPQYIIAMHPTILPKSNSYKLITYFHDIMPLNFVELPLNLSELAIFTRRLDKTVKNSRKIFVNSENTKKEILNLDESLTKKIEVLNPYAFLTLTRNSNDSTLFNILLQEYNISSTSKIITFVSAIEKRKNIHSLLDALSAIDIDPDISSKEDIAFMFIGKYDSNDEYIKNLFKKAKSFKNVKIVFTGYLRNEEKISLIKNSYLFLHISLYEGFGIPIIEAMSLGVPVLATRVGGSKEILNSDNSLTVDNPYDYASIAEKIKFAILNPEKIKLLAEKGKIFYQQNYSKEIFKEKLINYLLKE